MKKSRKGILDFIDIFFGRFSDSDTIGGERKRSWGVTVMFWLSLPLMLMVFSAGISQVVFALSYVPHVPKRIFKAYTLCLQKAKNLKFCKMPRVKSSSNSVRKMYFDKWSWIGAMFMFGSGLFFAIIRREQDFRRFKETATLLASFGEKSIPSGILEAFQSATRKISGEEVVDVRPSVSTSKGH